MGRGTGARSKEEIALLGLGAGAQGDCGHVGRGRGVPRGWDGMGMGAEQEREEAGGTKGPCAGWAAGERQQCRQERISRGCARVSARGVLEGHPLTPPGQGRFHAPNLRPPPKKPAGGAGSILG